MLYKSNQDLPYEIRNRYLSAVQDVYRAAFNSAIHWYGEAPKAHQVALSALRMHSAIQRNMI